MQFKRSKGTVKQIVSYASKSIKSGKLASSINSCSRPFRVVRGQVEANVQQDQIESRYNQAFLGVIWLLRDCFLWCQDYMTAKAEDVISSIMWLWDKRGNLGRSDSGFKYSYPVFQNPACLWDQLAFLHLWVYLLISESTLSLEQRDQLHYQRHLVSLLKL